MRRALPIPSSAPRPRSRARFTLALGLLLAAGACAGQRFARLFDETFAREALSCLHPSGQFVSAGEVHAESSAAFTATIFWKGGATANNYYTKLRVTVDGAVARLAVVEDTSILPALNDACTIELGGR
jgi:hypothetical protein